MDTKIKMAGGSYFDKAEPVWHGDLPLLTTGIGAKIMVNNGDQELLFDVSGVCIELSGKDSWQVVYVQPGDKATKKLLTENGSGVPKQIL